MMHQKEVKTGNYIYAEDLDGLRNYYNVEDNFDTIIDKINYILKNKAELAQQDGWNLFDALKEIVDSMETIKAFEDMELYHQVISKIDYVVEEDINFSNLYDSYTSSSADFTCLLDLFFQCLNWLFKI